MRESQDVYLARLHRAQGAAGEQGIGAILVTPGSDLRYLTGYDAKPLERLTCLVVEPGREPWLVVPRLELLAAASSPVVQAGIEVLTWEETEDPYALVAERLGSAARIAVDNHMWAEKVFRLRDQLPDVHLESAGSIIEAMRLIKDAAEVASLIAAGQAIDAVHSQVPSILRPGLTEEQVGTRIAELILEAGHVAVDFVIVASGPNAASPHHDVSERVLQMGDSVVVDIGGTMPDGYRSDCTRTYHLGEPTATYRERYDILEAAQRLAVESVRPGVTCESIDATARDHMSRSGLAELFIHRTGHGIGLESHEEPYIVRGNATPVVAGMAFSIEPGFYDEGHHGARIEDIVVVTDEGCISVNNRPHELVIV